MIRRIQIALGILAAIAVLIQLVPYRVSNPPVLQEPAWDSPRTAELARRACYDCHSNEVVVPWYGHIAPVAWLVRDHVDEGRAALNLSEMNRPQEEAHEAGEAVAEGEMPPAYYLALHPSARLTDAERAELQAGLDRTLGGEGGGHGSEARSIRDGDDGDDGDDD
ncbi:MAG: heme-binding domain-containing protein [Myxococcota bacterium]